MRRLIKRLLNSSVYRFIVVGSCSTGLDFCIYMLLSLKLPITISKGISMICSSVFSYWANKGFTFSNKEKTDIVRIIKFYGVFVLNLTVNVTINYFTYDVTGYKTVAFILATLGGMTVNYLGQRFVVFRKK